MDNKGRENEMICPIMFDPFQYYAKLETEDGKTEMIPVNHQKLAGVYLPKTIENPKEFLRKWEKQLYLEDMDNDSMDRCEGHTPTSDVPVVTQIGTIVRAEVPKTACRDNISNFRIFPKVRAYSGQTA